MHISQKCLTLASETRKNNKNNQLEPAATDKRHKIMKTFKVTFFDKELDVVSVITFHNVEDQSAFLDNLAIQIVTLDLLESVKCEAAGESYTQAVNNMLKHRIEYLKEA